MSFCRNQINNDNNEKPMSKIECGVYLRSTSPISLVEIFKECSDTFVPLTSHNVVDSVTTTASQQVLLCEVAETPESMREKLWQLERAVSYGPEDFRKPAFLVVCLNGEKVKFDSAVLAVKDTLLPRVLGCNESSPVIANFPVFAVWTPYRNVYAEIKTMKMDMESMKGDIHALAMGQESMKGDIHALAMGQESMKHDIHTLKSDFHSLKDDVHAILAIIRRANDGLPKPG